jgi:hypothetical protein
MGIATLTQLPTTATTSSNAEGLHDVPFLGFGGRSAAKPATALPERPTCSLAPKLTGHQMGPSCACLKEQLAGCLCPQPHPSERLSSSLPIIEWRGGPPPHLRRSLGLRSLERPQPGTYVYKHLSGLQLVACNNDARIHARTLKWSHASMRVPCGASSEMSVCLSLPRTGPQCGQSQVFCYRIHNCEPQDIHDSAGGWGHRRISGPVCWSFRHLDIAPWPRISMSRQFMPTPHQPCPLLPAYTALPALAASCPSRASAG